MKENEMARVGFGQRAFREVVARDLLHPIALKHKTELVDSEGLSRFHEILRSGKGGVVVANHFSALDPFWVMHEVTKEWDLRSIKLMQPIRWDRANPILRWAAQRSGLELKRIVTPHMWEDIKKTGNPNGFKEAQGLREYTRSAKRHLEEGGLLSIAANEERTSTLTLDKYNLLGHLLNYTGREEAEFGVHFVSPALKGVSDYSRHKHFQTVLRRAHIRHGATFTGGELWDMAEGLVHKEVDGSEYSKKDTIRQVSQIAFDQLEKISPPGYVGEKFETS